MDKNKTLVSFTDQYYFLKRDQIKGKKKKHRIMKHKKWKENPKFKYTKFKGGNLFSKFVLLV